MRLSGGKIPRSEMLLAAAVDRLSLIVWQLSGGDESNKPSSLIGALMDTGKTAEKALGFATPEEYETEWYRRTGVRHGQQ